MIAVVQISVSNFLQQLCGSTSAWSCCIVRNWGSRSKRWRRLSWTWWVCHRSNTNSGKCKKSIHAHTEALAFYSILALLSFQGEYEFSPEILSAKLAEVVYRDATGKIKGRFLKCISNSVQKHRRQKVCKKANERPSQNDEQKGTDLVTLCSCSWPFCPTEAEFVISLLNIAAIFDFTKDLQDSILQE